MENKKPIMCEIVGVEPQQRYTFPGGLNGPYYVDEKGHNRDRYGNCLSDEDVPYWEDAVNQKKIQLIDQYSSQEKEIMGHMLAVGYRYIAREVGFLFFSVNKPKRVDERWEELGALASMPSNIRNLFSSITAESEPVSIEEALA